MLLYRQGNREVVAPMSEVKSYNEEDIHLKPLAQHELPRDKITVDHNFGFSSMKANNMHKLDDNTLITFGNLTSTPCLTGHAMLPTNFSSNFYSFP